MTSDFMQRAARGAVIIAACTLSVAFFFRAEIANHFTVLNGDRYDAVIAIAILEHWSNLLRGFAPFADTNFFYPVHGTLGYNDGYFLTGMIDALFRALGADPYLAAELVAVLLRAIGFFAVYFAARRILALPLAFAIFAAVLATIANNMFVQAVHGQLFTVAFAPLMALLMDQAVRAFSARAAGRFLLAAAVSALFFGAWLLTAFYTAWFFVLFAGLFVASFISIAPLERAQHIYALFREQLWLVAAATLFFFAASAPFLAIYLPKAAETGQHAYLEAFRNTPSPRDLFDVGRGNLLFGALSEGSWSELQAAIAPGLLLLFFVVCFWLWRNRARTTETKWIVARALCLATLASLLLVIHIGPASAWSIIYVLVPGSHAIRVVSRFQLLLEFPVAVVAAFYLSEKAASFGVAVTALICAFLLAEEVNTEPPLHLHRTAESAFFASVPAAPPGCRTFFVSKARSEGQSGAFVDGVYSHNVDAMFIAETRNLRTVNGFGSFLPPGFDLIDPDRPDYLVDVNKFARRYGVANLCALDLRSKRWTGATPVQAGQANSPQGAE